MPLIVCLALWFWQTHPVLCGTAVLTEDMVALLPTRGGKDFSASSLCVFTKGKVFYSFLYQTEDVLFYILFSENFYHSHSYTHSFFSMSTNRSWAVQEVEENSSYLREWGRRFHRSFIFNFFNVYTYLRERQTEPEWRKGRERGRQNGKQAGGSELSAESPTWDLNSVGMRSWSEPKSNI